MGSETCGSLWVRLPGSWVGLCLGGEVALGLEGFPTALTYAFSVAVLGFKVNLAARMMMAYPGMVSCDAETYAASRLPSYCFKELPKRDMKGVTDPVTIYQYLGITEQ